MFEIQYSSSLEEKLFNLNSIDNKDNNDDKRLLDNKWPENKRKN